MGEQERPAYFDERLTTLAAVQEGLARRGYLFYPVSKEHAEALVTSPVLHRIHTHVKKRGFDRVTRKLILTFSGYAHDPREVFAIPEVRAYWQQLDAQVPELPALLAFLPDSGFNGPGLHQMLLGAIDAVVHHPAIGGYDVHVADAPQLIADATQRIRQAGRKYHLNELAVANLIDQFRHGAGAQR